MNTETETTGKPTAPATYQEAMERLNLPASAHWAARAISAVYKLTVAMLIPEIMELFHDQPMYKSVAASKRAGVAQLRFHGATWVVARCLGNPEGKDADVPYLAEIVGRFAGDAKIWIDERTAENAAGRAKLELLNKYRKSNADKKRLRAERKRAKAARRSGRR